MSRGQLFTFIVLLSVADAVLIGALIGTTAGPAAGVLAGLAGVALPWLVLGPVTGLIFRLGGWGRLMAAQGVRDGAAYAELHRVARLAPVFVLGKLPINNFTLIASDDERLLISPALATPGLSPGVVIPWERVEFETVEKDKHGLVRVRVDGVAVRLPMWACRREIEVRGAIEEPPA